MVRWWWFGPAVTKPELEREMRAMEAGGIGGFESIGFDASRVVPVHQSFVYIRRRILDQLLTCSR